MLYAMAHLYAEFHGTDCELSSFHTSTHIAYIRTVTNGYTTHISLRPLSGLNSCQNCHSSSKAKPIMGILQRLALTVSVKAAQCPCVSTDERSPRFVKFPRFKQIYLTISFKQNSKESGCIYGNSWVVRIESRLYIVCLFVVVLRPSNI